MFSLLFNHEGLPRYPRKDEGMDGLLIRRELVWGSRRPAAKDSEDDARRPGGQTFNLQFQSRHAAEHDGER